MFRSVPTKESVDQRAPNSGGATRPRTDDDNISLTSTVETVHSENEEFTVKAVHLKEIIPRDDGSEEVWYLVEWDGYPLHKCTWEPVNDEDRELFDHRWELENEQVRRGEVKAWTWETWEQVEGAAKEQYLARHRRRNERRRALGLPLTEPLHQQGSDSAADHSSSSDEDEDERPLAAIAAESRASSGQSTKSKGTTSVGPKSTSTKLQGRLSGGDAQPRPEPARRPSKDAGLPAGRERPSSTGYQGTARRPSLAGPRPGSGNSAMLSALGKSTGGKMNKAKKSGLVPGATNVFAGGTMRKTRVGLQDSMSNPTKEPRLFTRYRHLRLAEKASRNKEDRPPPLMPNLFAKLGPPARRKSGRVEPSSAASKTASTVQEPLRLPSGAAEPLPFRVSGTDTGIPSSAAEAQSDMQFPVDGSTNGARQSKRKKSVRFNDDDAALFVDEPTYMELDPPAGTSEATPEMWNRVPSQTITSTSVPAEPIRKRSVRFEDDDGSVPMEIDTPNPAAAPPIHRPSATCMPQVLTRVVETKLRFGLVDDSEPILASLDGVPSTSNDPWLSEFLGAEMLQFGYTCALNDFAFQRGHIWLHHLCAGVVSSGPSGPKLETAAAFLREGMLALYHTSRTYNIILYPGNSDKWRSLLAELGVPSSSNAGTGLAYCIFRSPEDLGSFLRRTAVKISDLSYLSYQERLMWRLFRFDYQALLLPGSVGRVNKDTERHCFLLFPRNKSTWFAAFARWVRLSNPECHIYSGYDAGSWSSFCDASGPGPGSGIVIVHELMAPSLRRVFGLWKRLQEHRDTFWCFSEAISPQPLFPSLTAPDEVVAPGEVSLVQLFPIPKRRVALFVTPSFLCSEPQRAFELLQWFYETWAKRTKLGSQTCKLVTAYDLSEYLETLALQKAREREDVLREHKENLAKGESAANVMGLSLDDCAYRFKAWSLALELHYLRTKSAGPYEGDEDLASLQYADQCIDPDDEQSLVNWFGWWSSARMDQFRGFYVVGSDSTLRPEKLSRVVRIPRYSETTFSDPDVVLEEVDRLTQERDRQQGQERHGSPSQHAPTISAPRTTTPYVWRSRRVVREDAFSFTTALAEIWANRRRTRETFVTAYKFPVSWLNSTQAEALRGHEPSTRSFHTLHQWWRFPNPFWTHHAHKFCTYLGFFYTTVDELPQPAAEFGAPVDERPPRHPWLCIYRPAEPYTRKPRAGACELIIWDPAAQDRFAGVRAPKEGDLTFMQRQAIQVIRNGTEMKNQGSWLETVWLGGFDHPRRADSDHPVDLTLQYMEDIVNHVEEELPVGETALRSRGFRKVKPRGAGLDTPGDRSPAGSKPTNTRSQGFNAAGENDDDDEDTRLIFHPPRGRPLPSGERTKCINRLYECAATTSRNDPQATHMRYASPPTTEWYDVQRSEGRSFEHVYVAPWGYVFKALRVQAAGISGSDTPRTSNARQEEQQQQQQQVGRVVSGH